MTEFLFLLKRVLTYKVLLVVISIAMIYTLYENDNTSLQQEPSKPHKKRTLRKSPPNQRQKEHSTGSFGSLHLSNRRDQSDSQQGTEGRQNQMVQNKESEPQHQQKPLNVSEGEGPKEPCLSQKNLIPQALELECPKKREKSDDGRLHIRTGFFSAPFIKDGQWPGKGWTRTDRGSESFWIYCPGSQQGTKGEDCPISRMVRLRNSFIPHPRQDTLWLRPTFYSDSDVAALATTSKYAYIQSKKLPTNMSNEDPNSYMLHPAYKTCVMEMELRAELMMGTDPINKIQVDSVVDRFEGLYALLLGKARKKGYASYKFFWKIPSCSLYWIYKTAMSFLTRKFVEKRQWTLGDLESSKDALKGEFVQAMEEWTSTRNYDFIPEIHKVDPNLYRKFLKTMQLLRVPFCDCSKISQLLVSSRDEPLKLFLFWDAFNALKMEILGWDLRSYNERYSLISNGYAKLLISRITDVYSNQNRGYLRDLCFELVGAIQSGFFGDGQLYQPSQTEEQRRAVFDDYMLDIQGQVQTFLEDRVFDEPSIAIRV